MMDSAFAPDRHSAAAERVDSSSVLVAKVSYSEGKLFVICTVYPQRLRFPIITFATNKLSTGGNGQKEDAASFFCIHSFDPAARLSSIAATGPVRAQ